MPQDNNNTSLEEYVMEPGALCTETVLKDGVSIYSNKTKEEYLEKDYLVLSWDEVYQELRANEERVYIKEWEEVAEEDYNFSLEVLPPIKWQSIDGASLFYVSEAYASNIYAHFVKIGNRCFKALRRNTTSYPKLLTQIKTQFDLKFEE